MRVNFRSDGERPITVLVFTLATKLKKKGVAVVPDPTPIGDSHGGSMQKVVRIKVENKARCLHEVDQDESHN